MPENGFFFCPHMTLKQSFRCGRLNSRNHFSTSEESSKKLEQERQPVIFNSQQSSVSDIYAGGDNSTTTSVARLKHKTPTPTETKSLVCDECDQNVGPMSPSHLWRCLDPRCRAMLCGSQGCNHSHQHALNYTNHYLQENVASRRVWCNDCNREVFPGFRNRRPVPAVWRPAEECEDEPPRGLYNIGNTCFMNAALQSMAAVSPLNSYFLGQCCTLKGKNVASSYLWLLSELWPEQETTYQKGVMPSRLLYAVRTAHPIFRGFQQHDTQEFLRLFMDSLAEETRVPHFVFEEVPPKTARSSGSEDGTSTDSETESFETCDSGNASEETMSADTHVSDTNSSDGQEPEAGPHKEVKIRMRSIVSEIFDGQLDSSVQCLSCKQVSSRMEVFQDLSLPIPTRDEIMTLRNAEKFGDNEEGATVGWFGWIFDWIKSFFWGPAPTLEDCFSAFFSSDELKGKNMYSCEKCGKLRNGVKKCSLHRLPEVLCVHLKRFRMYEYSGGMGFSGKICQYVKFPMEQLDLRTFLHKDCSSQTTTYRLLGAICHIGSFLGGHYTAYIRRMDQWYLCDDSRVTPVSAETVAECEAYVLFYEKCNEEETTNFTRENALFEWTTFDNNNPKNGQFHLVSRKWLTQFFFSEEVGPIDNSDVVCPHGFLVPHDATHYGATWVPKKVWDLLMTKYGGGPDLLQPEECLVCSVAWKKFVKASQAQRSKGASESSSSNASPVPNHFIHPMTGNL